MVWIIWLLNIYISESKKSRIWFFLLFKCWYWIPNVLKPEKFKCTTPTCCVFWPANRCSTCRLHVEHPFAGQNHFFTLKQVFPSFSIINVKNAKNNKKMFLRRNTNDFNQRTTCRAPICWSKYITPAIWFPFNHFYSPHLATQCRMNVCKFYVELLGSYV